MLTETKISNLIDKIAEASNKLRSKKKAEGKKPKEKTTYSNSKCQYETIEEEQKERREIIKEHLKIYQNIFPDLIEGFKEIKDPRNPNKIEHKLISAFIYGMFIYILKIPSRRQANKILTRPQFMENVNIIFPELEDIDDLPHGDTVDRILSKIDIEKIQQIHIKIIKGLIKNKTFEKYKTTNGYMINIDGTRKFSSEYPFSKKALKRDKSTNNGKKTEYYVYILEANITFECGVSIPLLTEFCEFSKGNFENNKQDCEITAFKRLASKLKSYFPRLRISLNLDGLYPSGPIFRICREKNWGFMITLPDDKLKEVWCEGLARKDLINNNTHDNLEGDREQHFWWVNDIEYRYENGQKKEVVNLVVCEEIWEEVNEDGEIEKKTKKFAWISSKPINKHNVTIRCNKIARSRWFIEEEIDIEKNHGYNSEHLYSKNWKAMKGFHYLMRIVRLIEVLCYCSYKIYEKIKSIGIIGVVKLFTETLTVKSLDKDEITTFLKKDHYMQLAWL